MSFVSVTAGDNTSVSSVCDMEVVNKLRGTKRNYSEDKRYPCKKHKKTHKWFKKIRRKHLRDKRRKNRKGIRTKPEAPFNSTQFIMEEHDKLNEGDLSSNSRPRRQRDSSISMDSDDCDFYTSEEEEFLRRDIWTTFEDAHAELLDTLPHSQLMKEYLALEDKVSFLEQEYILAREQDRPRIREPSPGPDDEEESSPPGEVPVDAETAAKIEVFRNEIKNLQLENLKLKREYAAAPKPCPRCQLNSSLISDSSTQSDSETDTRIDEDNQTYNRTPNATRCGEVEIVNFDVIESTNLRRCEKISDTHSDSGVASFEALSSGDDVKIEHGSFKVKT